MAGHNKWKQIKERKGSQDKKKAQLYSKTLTAISAAAKEEANPELNPRLKGLIEKAREQNVPKENIERALSRAGEAKDLKEIIVEAYGPDSIPLIIEAITDNSNRTINELRTLLTEAGAKVAEHGSVLWAFDHPSIDVWKAKFPQEASKETMIALASLTELIEEHADVQRVITGAASI